MRSSVAELNATSTLLTCGQAARMTFCNAATDGGAAGGAGVSALMTSGGALGSPRLGINIGPSLFESLGRFTSTSTGSFLSGKLRYCSSTGGSSLVVWFLPNGQPNHDFDLLGSAAAIGCSLF